MNVYTYYDDCGMRSPTGLITYWAESWTKRGWTPIVLGLKEAEQSPMFQLVDKAAQILPTVNIKAYERTNYLRFCAMDTIGGGLLVDYDCINYSFVEEDLLNVKRFNLVRLAEGGFIWMTSYGVHQFCRQIYDWCFNEKVCILLDGRPHLSDMHMLMLLNTPVVPGFCYNYKTVGWAEAKVVHFSTDSLGTYDNKELKIKQLRAI